MALQILMQTNKKMDICLRMKYTDGIHLQGFYLRNNHLRYFLNQLTSTTKQLTTTYQTLHNF